MGYGFRIAFNALRTSSTHFCLPAIAAAIACAGAAFPAYAEVNETVLYSFSGGSDGGAPWAGVIADDKGALYGTTIGGGISSPACSGQCGVVFKLTPPPFRQPPWSEATLWTFSGGNDGGAPFAGLFAGNESPSRKRTVYGATSSGGTLSACGGSGCGTIFGLVGGNLITLWSFSGGVDGDAPAASLIADEETGALYGTTSGFGTSGNGTVFKIDTNDQTLTTIYTFSGSPDGANPLFGALLVDDTGALYGTTSAGGASGNGTVFKLTPPARGQTTWTESVLWSFTGGSDGASPQSGLIADERGALYGTTSAGGASGNGTVFRLTPPDHRETTWKLATLYTFSGGSDGSLPTSALIADKAGALYGTTQRGGTFSGPVGGVLGSGVVFKLTPPAYDKTPWTETVLWSFLGGSDGGDPVPGLIADEQGALYGTAEFGGNVNPQGPCSIYGCGVVFKLTGTGFATEDDD